MRFCATARIAVWVVGVGGWVACATQEPQRFPINAVSEASEQVAKPGGTVDVPPTVQIVDANGQGVSGISVIFSPLVQSGTVSPEQVTTDAAGYATADSWTLENKVGLQAVEARVNNKTIARFEATAIPCPSDWAAIDAGASWEIDWAQRRGEIKLDDCADATYYFDRYLVVVPGGNGVVWQPRISGSPTDPWFELLLGSAIAGSSGYNAYILGPGTYRARFIELGNRLGAYTMTSKFDPPNSEVNFCEYQSTNNVNVSLKFDSQCSQITIVLYQRVSVTHAKVTVTGSFSVTGSAYECFSGNYLGGGSSSTLVLDLSLPSGYCNYVQIQPTSGSGGTFALKVEP